MFCEILLVVKEGTPVAVVVVAEAVVAATYVLVFVGERKKQKLMNKQ